MIKPLTNLVLVAVEKKVVLSLLRLIYKYPEICLQSVKLEKKIKKIFSKS